jgi:hypothetical protein
LDHFPLKEILKAPDPLLDLLDLPPQDWAVRQRHIQQADANLQTLKLGDDRHDSHITQDLVPGPGQVPIGQLRHQAQIDKTGPVDFEQPQRIDTVDVAVPLFAGGDHPLRHTRSTRHCEDAQAPAPPQQAKAAPGISESGRQATAQPPL